MKTLLKKSFEQFVKEQNELYKRIGERKTVDLKGNISLDLEENFYKMILQGVFYKLPKNFAFNKREESWGIDIHLVKMCNSYLLTDAIFRVCEDGAVEEGEIGIVDKDLTNRFFESMRELVKQMNQYYIDHDLKEDK